MLKLIRNIIRSNVFAWIRRFENPEKLVEQSLIQMHESLSGLRQQYVSASAGHKRMLTRQTEIEATVEQAGERAGNLARAGDDKAARVEIMREISADRLLKHYQSRSARQEELVAALRESLSELEAKVEDAKRRRDELKARTSAARARQEIGAAFAGVNRLQGQVDMSSWNTLEQMEDRVRNMEAESEAMAEINHQMAALGGVAMVSIACEDPLIDKRLEEIKASA